MVRVIGLEPTRLAAPEPKSGASTNFATPARVPEGREYSAFTRFRRPLGERLSGDEGFAFVLLDHLHQLREDLRRTGNDVAGVEVVGVASEVAHQATGLLHH